VDAPLLTQVAAVFIFKLPSSSL